MYIDASFIDVLALAMNGRGVMCVVKYCLSLVNEWCVLRIRGQIVADKKTQFSPSVSSFQFAAFGFT